MSRATSLSAVPLTAPCGLASSTSVFPRSALAQPRFQIIKAIESGYIEQSPWRVCTATKESGEDVMQMMPRRALVSHSYLVGWWCQTLWGSQPTKWEGGKTE